MVKLKTSGTVLSFLNIACYGYGVTAQNTCAAGTAQFPGPYSIRDNRIVVPPSQVKLDTGYSWDAPGGRYVNIRSAWISDTHVRYHLRVRLNQYSDDTTFQAAWSPRGDPQPLMTFSLSASSSQDFEKCIEVQKSWQDWELTLQFY